MTAPISVLAIDQGTTSSRAILFNARGEAIISAQQEFPQHFPNPGWVEHDPADILSTTFAVVKSVLQRGREKRITPGAIGITNQRETTLIWDRKTGKAIHNAIVWQDRRTAPTCDALRQRGALPMIRERTGLVIDPYFSATKIAWILDKVEGARARAEAGELCFGTVDSFLLWHLTGGAVHATDATNAARTSLMNISTGAWDDELLNLFGVPAALLPEIRDCATSFGTTTEASIGTALPICGIVGDQHASLIGHGALSEGDVKCTFGTGAFLVANAGTKRTRSGNGLIDTVGYQVAGKRTYALEGSILVAGSALQWLRDGLQILDDVADSADIAASVEDNGGVSFVPAFTGLGAPHWDAEARGVLSGLTRGSTRAHIIRATLEGVAHQTTDLVEALLQDGVQTNVLKIDGGMARNEWFAQCLADFCGVPVECAANAETTALGAASVAAFGAALTDSIDGLIAKTTDGARFEPAMSDTDRSGARESWRTALSRAKSA